MDRREFPCSMDGMAAAKEFLEQFCEEPRPAIITDEIVSNIVRCSGADSFSVSFERVPEGLRLEFSDNGCPFDPTADAPKPDVTAPVEDREIGGLGLFMVRRMSKSVGYARRENRNVLTVVV